jgi:hypothetical protein
MKESKLQKILAILLGLMLCISLPSCSRDEGYEEDEGEVVAPIAYLRARYSVQLAQAWYDYYDIEMSYTDLTGAQNTRTITKDTAFDEQVEISLATNTLSFYVVAKPKANAPEVSDSTAYSISHSCKMTVIKLTGSETSLLHEKEAKSSASTGGDVFRNQLSKTHTIINTSYTIE